MNFARNKPTAEEKRRLPGGSNIEALLLAVDARLMRDAGEPKIDVLLVGRASYEVGSAETRAKLRDLLGETDRLSAQTGKLLLTDDVDCYATDETEQIVALAHRGSYVAELCEAYVHALSDETLFMPLGWKDRIELITGMEGLEALQLHRLGHTDFFFCKASAGRPKDETFLRAFVQAVGLTLSELQAAYARVEANPPTKFMLDPSCGSNIRMMLSACGPFCAKDVEEILPPGPAAQAKPRPRP